MRRLLQLVIQVYWSVVPEEKRRSCLYRESCSRHVWRRLEDGGVSAGLAAFRDRWRRCRPGYSVVPTSVGTFLLLRDHSMLAENEINPRLLFGSPPPLAPLDAR